MVDVDNVPDEEAAATKLIGFKPLFSTVADFFGRQLGLGAEKGVTERGVGHIGRIVGETNRGDAAMDTRGGVHDKGGAIGL